MLERFLKSSILRFTITGAVAAGVNLIVLFLLTHYFALWYLASSVVAFGVAFFVNFYFQKYWVFRDKEGRVMNQIGLFFIVALVNLVVNTMLLAFFVEIIDVWYIAAQILTTGIIAVGNYFVYKRLVFVSNR